MSGRAKEPFHETVTTAPLSQDADSTATEGADEPRPSIASLLQPPVGSVNPDGWRSPVSRTTERTYRPPEFDAETRAALQAKYAEEERQAAEAEAALRAEVEAARVRAREEEEQAARRRRKKPKVPELKVPELRVPAVKVPTLRHRDEREHPAGVEPVKGEVAETAPPTDDWTSAAPAIEHLHKQFFARPEELRPASVEDQVLESGPDLQLRIYMREILEPWWTGEVGSTTALKRLVALRDSLTEDPT
jgi:hypothetical protein